MSVERIPIADRASWLALRQRDVTASTAGCLLGVHEYQTAYGLWALKTGRIQEDPEESAPMRRGRLLEPVAFQLLREERPDWKIAEPGIYLRDPAIHLGATPDLFAEDPERGPGIVQVKTVEPSAFRRKWRDEETGEVSPPLWIACQAIVEAHLAGAAWAAVAAMTVSFGVELHLVPVPIHAGIIERIRAAVVEFWAMIDEGREPEPDYGRDGEIIARLFEEDHGTEIDLSADNMLPGLVAERSGIRANIKDAEARVSEIDTEVKAKIGHHAAAILRDGKRITWRTQHRKAFAVEAKDYRVLRYPSIKEISP